ncbi:CPBP family intramembrane metalloprotease [Romboutsia maritimum]|uniref:CPBP family intramembrane metalloprotease n=1 Tax=Romboutsia maritimum TaxID=2020948 RepID=A0A371ITW7_9FIRM|nr:ABC transporter permease subunit/CPBP intramembrane protease [Romboutsia maritimum]RDY23934.1 CPBP family intramembrane metalloprotease [Romboutsia maritimum]
MRSKIVKYIFKKEMIDILRDKKTLFMMIVLPIILYPVLIVGMTQVMTMTMNSMNEKDIKISFNTTPDKDLVNIINENKPKEEKKDGKLKIVDVGNYEEALEEQKIDAYIKIIKDEKIQNYKIYVNSSKENSNIASNKIEDVLNEYKRDKIENKLEQENMNVKETLEPISFETVDTAKNEEIAGYFLGQILPFILIIGVLLGAIYPAIDVMAGEKERGTLETLFTLPITNLELVIGKYMAVSFCAIVTAVLNVLSILLTMVFIATSGGLASQLGVDGFNFGQLAIPIFITLICICLFSMVVSAISMCVCSLAKSFKDAQNYITPVMLLVMIPSYVSMIPNIKLNRMTATIPVVNISLLIKSVLTFKADLNLIVLVMISNLAFVILSVILLSKMFNSEEILFGNNKSFSFLEKRCDIKKGTIPSVSDGVILYAVGLVLLIYVGTLVQIKFKIIGIGLTQIMIIALPVLFALYIKSDLKKIFRINIPSFKSIIGSILLWMGGFIIVQVITQGLLYLFPQNMEVVEALNNTLFIKDKFLMNLFIIAVMPAICEEIFFRGFIFTSFNRSKKTVKVAIICSGILFGFMHMDFLRIVPTSILGILFAYSVYKSGSILTSMIMHFLNNGLIVFMGHYPDNKLIKMSSFIELNFNESYITKLAILLAISAVLVLLGIVFLKEKKNKLEAYTD